MKIVDSVRRWLKKKQSPNGGKMPPPPREFVYLDEVSVYSLIASQTGAIAAEFTETESVAQRDEIASSTAANAAVVKSEVASKLSTEQSSGSQVVSKSIVQGTFRELVERVDLAFQANMSDPPEPIREVDALAVAITEDDYSDWIFDPATLTRGQLLEIEVELETESIYRVSAILNAMIEMVTENPEIIGPDDLVGMQQGITGSRILDKLLAGLVPLRGRSVDYLHVTLDDRERIIHRALLEDLPPSERLEVRPLYLVGVAEVDLFWRDLRRILFSNSTYFAMCRLGRDGVNAEWTPVKLLELLNETLPDMAEHLDQAVELLHSIGASRRGGVDEDARPELFRTALIAYGEALAAHHGQSVSEADLNRDGLIDENESVALGSLEERRAAFGAVTDLLRKRFNFGEDRVLEAQFRETALSEAGLDLSGNTLVAAPTYRRAPDSTPEPRYLDAEIVAIYW